MWDHSTFERHFFAMAPLFMPFDKLISVMRKVWDLAKGTAREPKFTDLFGRWMTWDKRINHVRFH